MWHQAMTITFLICSLIALPSMAQGQNEGPWAEAIQELSQNLDPNADPHMLRTILLQILSNQQQQPQQSQEERSMMAPPIIGDDEMAPTAMSLRTVDDKKSNMRICYFKICNMGRKRNARPPGWVRD